MVRGGGLQSMDSDPIGSFFYSLLHEKAIDDAELDKLFTACKDWGFFQVVNHGVSSQLREKLKLEIEKFFKLPIEEKKKYQIRAGDVQGYGTVIR
ncbi:hypothetical protein JHK86_027290 [Glycine max]|nr:hypothetical protein JHK86_027290 [Glycine max]